MIRRGLSPHPGAAEVTRLEKIPRPISHHRSVLPSGDQEGSACWEILRPGPIAQRGVEALGGLPVR
jgi:hypothetical protein